MELITKDLILRTVTEDDLKEIARMWKYPERISLEEACQALAKMERSHQTNRPKAIHYLCLGVFLKKSPKKIIGWCGLDGQVSPGKTALFYIIDKEFRCKGYATQCAWELLRYAFQDMRYDVVYGGCAKENGASFRVMEKAGMCHHTVYEDGGLGFYMDRKMYRRQYSKWTPPVNFGHYFDPASDEAFKAKHPIGYGFLVFLGIAVLFLPCVVFFSLVNADSAWMMLGAIGGFIFGIGLFNFVAIIIKQYLGHWVSIITFLIGGAMMLASWLLCR